MMLNWFVAGRGDFEDVNAERPVEVATSPEGSAFVVITRPLSTGTGGRLRRYEPTSRVAGSGETDLFLREAGRSASIAIGPGGLVFVASGNAVWATCRGERVLWTLTNEAAPGEELRANFSTIFASGEHVFALSNAERYYRVPVDGSSVESVGEAEAAGISRSRSVFASFGDDLIERLDESRGSILNTTFVLPGGVPVEADWLTFSPTGVAYFRDEGLNPASVLLPPYEGPATQFVSELEVNAAPNDNWLADGSYLDVAGAGGNLVRVSAQGDEVWRLPELGSGTSQDRRVISSSGVLYSVRNGNLLAIQLDELPPDTSFCIRNFDCNEYRNSNRSVLTR
ncbi:MAG: hypothetical protein AAF645_14420 [Myxococcota bacterium]